MDISVAWTGTALVPADERSLKFLSRQPEGMVLAATVHTGKDEIDLTRHNQFFAILDRCVDSLAWYNIQSGRDREAAKEDLLLKLKYECGFTRTIQDMAGHERVIPLSLEFGSGVSEQAREAFRSMAYSVLCRVMNCSRAELFGAV